MVGDMGHMDGLITPALGADNTEPVFQIPVGLPSLERGRRVKKWLSPCAQYMSIETISTRHILTSRQTSKAILSLRNRQTIFSPNIFWLPPSSPVGKNLRDAARYSNNSPCSISQMPGEKTEWVGNLKLSSTTICSVKRCRDDWAIYLFKWV